MLNADFRAPQAVPYRLSRATATLMFAASEPAPVTYSVVKRSFDIVVAAGLLLLFLPMLALSALAIRLESPGPALYRQRRTGLWGRPFTIYKLRTMVNAERSHQVRQASKGDSRVTRVGAFLRKQSLDELPQLINVLKGDMSIVGPRPHALKHDDQYSAVLPAYAQRFRTKPGLTGLAQVSGLRGEITNLDVMAARIAQDNAYIERWSFLLDLQILLRTVPLLIRDPQAY